MRCEDYPCCGHGPPPYGDGGGCPDEEGRFDCVLCGHKLPKNHHRSICDGCIEHRQGLKICWPEEIAYQKGFIDDAQVNVLADKLGKSGYGNYLRAMLGDTTF